MKILTVDDVRPIISGYAGVVPEATLLLVAAILRQHRILLVQVSLSDYIQHTAGTQRLTWELTK